MDRGQPGAGKGQPGGGKGQGRTGMGPGQGTSRNQDEDGQGTPKDEDNDGVTLVPPTAPRGGMERFFPLEMWVPALRGRRGSLPPPLFPARPWEPGGDKQWGVSDGSFLPGGHSRTPRPWHLRDVPVSPGRAVPGGMCQRLPSAFPATQDRPSLASLQRDCPGNVPSSWVLSPGQCPSLPGGQAVGNTEPPPAVPPTPVPHMAAPLPGVPLAVSPTRGHATTSCLSPLGTGRTRAQKSHWWQDPATDLSPLVVSPGPLGEVTQAELAL